MMELPLWKSDMSRYTPVSGLSFALSDTVGLELASWKIRFSSLVEGSGLWKLESWI